MIRTFFTSNFKYVAAADLFTINRLRFFSMAADKRLEGKVALITGGASGIGKATAHEFIEHGAQVIIADIDSQMGPKAAHDLGPKAHFVKCDVAIEAQVAQAVETTMSRHGKLDIMYNNVGITGSSYPPSITDLDLDEFDRVMHINVRGMIAGIKHAARAMILVGSGSILCTSSISGLMGGLGPHPYTISKFTILGILKSIASDLCKSGIRINCISPAPIPTPMSVDSMAKFYPKATRDQIVDMINGLGELKGAKCEEKDVAKAALYLASDESKFITDITLLLMEGSLALRTLVYHPQTSLCNIN